MSCNLNSSDINQTFIIEPIFVPGGGASSITACTGVYTNVIFGCEYNNNQILLNSGETIFNSSITAPMVNSYDLQLSNRIITYENQTGASLAGKFLSGTSNGFILSDISNIKGVDTYVTGGTFSNGTSIFTNNFGDTFSVTGYASIDTYVTGGTYNQASGVTTFTNNFGNAFDVSGYFTGYTETPIFGTGTTNILPKFNPTNGLTNSQIIDDGTNIDIANGIIRYEPIGYAGILPLITFGKNIATSFYMNATDTGSFQLRRTGSAFGALIRLGSAWGTLTAQTNSTMNQSLGGISFEAFTGLGTGVNGFTPAASIGAGASASASSTNASAHMIFKTTPTGSTTHLERMRLTDAGNLLINTTTDNSIDKLQVNGTILSTGFIKSGGTSSQFLMADGSISTGITNAIAGSGTSGQVAFFNSSNSISGSTGFTWNDTNKRLGAGVATPSTNLHVNQPVGAGASKGILLSGDEYTTSGNGTPTTGVRFLLGVNRVGNRQLWIGDDAAVGSPTLGMFRYQTGIAGYAGLDSTTGDGLARLLTLIGTDTSNVGIGYNSSSVTTTEYIGKLNVFSYNENRTNLLLKKYGTNLGDYMSVISPTLTTLFTIKNNGNVIINSATDTGEKLQVSGTSRFNGIVNINVPSSTGTREQVFTAQISDSGSDMFGIANGTGVDGRFIPVFYNFSNGNYNQLGFRSLTTTSGDTIGGNPMIAFQPFLTNTTIDPNNGLLSRVINRPLMSMTDPAGNYYFLMNANGNLMINTGIDNGIDKLQISGSVFSTGGYKISGGTSSQFLMADGSVSSGTTISPMIKDEFIYTSGPQTFTTSQNYSQVFSVSVQGGGALKADQYTLSGGNTVTITDTLDSGDYIIILFTASVTGSLPYYTQAQTDSLLNLKMDKQRETKIISTEAYTLSSSDSDKILYFTSSSAITLTIPSGLTLGNSYEVFQQGTGQISFTSSGTTIRYSSLELPMSAERYSLIGIDSIANVTEEYHIYGQLYAI